MSPLWNDHNLFLNKKQNKNVKAQPCQFEAPFATHMKYNILQAVQKNIYVNGKELGCLEIYSVFKNSKQPKITIVFVWTNSAFLAINIIWKMLVII